MKLNTSLRTNNRLVITLSAAVALTALSTSHAAVVNISLDNTWMESTTVVTDVDGLATWVTNVNTAPPAASTFTTPVVLGGNSVVNATDAAAIGGASLLFGNDIHYIRKTFTLTDLTGITASIELSVDNGMGVWINGSLVGAETSFLVDNWQPTYPGFDIDASGNIQNISKVDVTNSFTGFMLGTNEVILAVRNLDSSLDTVLPAGAAVFNMEITTVPEPSSALLMGLGALGLLMRRRK